MNICMRSFRRLRQNRVGRIYCLCYRLPLLSFLIRWHVCFDLLLLEERSRQVNYLRIQALPPTLPPSLPHTRSLTGRASCSTITNSRKSNRQPSIRFWVLSTIVRWFRVISDHPMEAFQVRSNVLLCIKSCCRHPNLSPSCRNWCGYLQRCTYLRPMAARLIWYNFWYAHNSFGSYIIPPHYNTVTHLVVATVAHTISHQSVL